MYAIVSVIYGVLLEKNANEYEYRDYEIDDVDEPEMHVPRTLIANSYDQSTKGFLSYYSGDGGSPCAFGIEIATIDEGENVQFSEMKLVPTKKQIEKYQKYYDSLPKELKSYFGKKPSVFILWSNS